MQPNPSSVEFNAVDFNSGAISTQRVLELYKQQPVQHRGPEIVRNEEHFKQIVGVTFAPNGRFETTVATLGPALWAMTGGTHPIIDFRQPVRLPEGHPKVNFLHVLRAQAQIGFGHETGELENEEDKPPPSLLETAHLFAAELMGLEAVEEDSPAMR